MLVANRDMAKARRPYSPLGLARLLIVVFGAALFHPARDGFGNMMTPRRAAWFAFGAAALGLGVIGIVVPLLPTTPFLLLAAFAFARSSERWHAWLIGHRVFGPMIQNWRTHGAISRRAKISALIAMAVVLGISAAMHVPLLLLAIQALVLAAVAAFILSRPIPPRD